MSPFYSIKKTPPPKVNLATTDHYRSLPLLTDSMKTVSIVDGAHGNRVLAVDLCTTSPRSAWAGRFSILIGCYRGSDRCSALFSHVIRATYTRRFTSSTSSKSRSTVSFWIGSETILSIAPLSSTSGATPDHLNGHGRIAAGEDDHQEDRNPVIGAAKLAHAEEGEVSLKCCARNGHDVERATQVAGAYGIFHRDQGCDGV
jgi:hypothetical protein